MPIAIPPFGGDGGNGQLGQQVTGVVSNDLQSSGLFQPLDPKSFLQDVSAGQTPNSAPGGRSMPRRLSRDGADPARRQGAG